MRHRGPVAPLMKTHPLTGEPIVPVGVVNGKVIWPICGGAETDDEDDDKDKDGADSGDTGSGGADKGKDAGSDGDDEPVSKEDYKALLKRMQAADRRAAEAEKKIKDAEDAEKGDLEKATGRVAELEKEVETLSGTLRSLRLQNAFLTANKHTWHDPDTALTLAQNQGYVEDDIVDDDGQVDKKRLAKALDRLAAEKPYLVKPADDKKDQPDSPSGEPAGGRSDNAKDDAAAKEKLRRRFPVLNR